MVDINIAQSLIVKVISLRSRLHDVRRKKKKRNGRNQKVLVQKSSKQPKEKLRNFRWNCNQLKKKKRNLNIFPERNGDSRQRGTGETEARNCVQSGGNIIYCMTVPDSFL